MIKFKLKDKTVSIPTKWEEVTYKQYIDLLTLKDDTIQLISIFTGQDYEVLKNAVIIGLDDILTSITFVNTLPEFPTSVNKCGPYKIPNNEKGQFNIQHESLAQYEDMRQVMKKAGADLNEHVKSYGKYVAIYLQKIKDGEYKPLRVPQMEEEIGNYPAFEVCTLGAFFFLKLKNYPTGSQKTSPSTPRNLKKSKQALKHSPRLSAVLRQSSKRRKS
jgi:hypothetical protein